MTDAPQQVNVRRAGMADLDTLVRFNAAMAWETEGRELDPGQLREGVVAGLNNEGLGFYLVAETDGRVVGQLLVTSEWSDWRNGFFWWIQSVYVDPAYRRQGVYRALEQKVKHLALAQGGVCGIRLYVDRANQVAQNVYRSLGMSQSNYDMYEIEFER